MSKYLSADDILNANDRTFFEVENPEWATPSNPQGLVRVRQLTATERDQWETSFDKDVNPKASRNRINARASLVAKVVVDETGSRVFKTAEQVQMLGQKSVIPINRIFETVMKESKVSADDLAIVEGNSEGATSDDTAFP